MNYKAMKKKLAASGESASLSQAISALAIAFEIRGDAFNSADKKILRSVCKDFKSIVDKHIKSIEVLPYDLEKPPKLKPSYLPTVTEITLSDSIRYGGGPLKDKIENIVTLLNNCASHLQHFQVQLIGRSGEELEYDIAADEPGSSQSDIIMAVLGDKKWAELKELAIFVHPNDISKLEKEFQSMVNLESLTIQCDYKNGLSAKDLQALLSAPFLPTLTFLALELVPEMMIRSYRRASAKPDKPKLTMLAKLLSKLSSVAELQLFGPEKLTCLATSPLPKLTTLLLDSLPPGIDLLPLFKRSRPLLERLDLASDLFELEHLYHLFTSGSTFPALQMLSVKSDFCDNWDCLRSLNIPTLETLHIEGAYMSDFLQVLHVPVQALPKLKSLALDGVYEHDRVPRKLLKKLFASPLMLQLDTLIIRNVNMDVYALGALGKVSTEMKNLRRLEMDICGMSGVYAFAGIGFMGGLPNLQELAVMEGHQWACEDRTSVFRKKAIEVLHGAWPELKITFPLHSWDDDDEIWAESDDEMSEDDNDVLLIE